MRSHGGGHRMMRFLRKSGIDERSAMLVVGVCAVTMAGLLMAVGEYSGRYFSKPLVEIVFFGVLALWFPESKEKHWKKASVVIFIILGLALGAVWIVFFGFPAVDSTEFKRLDKFSSSELVFGLSASLVTAPLFEEKVARHLILDGLGALHAFIASSIVSIAFALTHVGSIIWAFLASMLLCFFALGLKMTSVQRAISHGVCNLSIVVWYYTDAYGIAQG
jgi:hypothetical protein